MVWVLSKGPGPSRCQEVGVPGRGCAKGGPSAVGNLVSPQCGAASWGWLLKAGKSTSARISWSRVEQYLAADGQVVTTAKSRAQSVGFKHHRPLCPPVAVLRLSSPQHPGRPFCPPSWDHHLLPHLPLEPLGMSPDPKCLYGSTAQLRSLSWVTIRSLLGHLLGDVFPFPVQVLAGCLFSTFSPCISTHRPGFIQGRVSSPGKDAFAPHNPP